MKLTASLIVRNELHRLLEPCIQHLLEFCDQVCIFDNGSTDGWEEALRPSWVSLSQNVLVWADVDPDGAAGSMFVNHAARRQRLLELTLATDPVWILAIDADEFVADGVQLRAACEREEKRCSSMLLCLQEVWGADSEGLQIRQDGGWVEHDVAMVWQPALTPGQLTIVDRGPATGRTPDQVGRGTRGYGCTELLHFGWANQQERADRHHRYVVADGGRFHNKRHLDSIMWPDEKVRSTVAEWPAGLGPWREQIAGRVNP